MVKGQTHLLVSQGGRCSVEFQSSTVRLYVVNSMKEKKKKIDGSGNTCKNSAFPLAGLSAVKPGIHRQTGFLQHLKPFKSFQESTSAKASRSDV